MNNARVPHGFSPLVIVAAFVTFLLAGCTGDNGSQGPAGPPGASPTDITDTATSLTMTISSVTVNSPPVVNFSVAAENGKGFVGLTTSNLRFLIAKLTPGTNGNPSVWQNYIVTTQNGTAMGAPLAKAVQGTRENNGTLVDHGDGTYTYTFKTDITNVACPSPCQDASGNPLNLSYQPTLTHRVGIQTAGSLPAVNATFDFVPAGGAVTTRREIVKTAKCNECHDKLEAHDARIETKYCVACHNPGSTDPDTGNTVDFKVMIHKIHRGEDLPSNVAGGDYKIIGFGGSTHSFKDVVFPQDIKNCTKCHDGADADTPQGDNWKMQPSIQACGSCHDDKDFSKDGSGTPPADPNGHSGGIVTDNSECLTCHATGRIAGSIADSHRVFEKLAAAKFKFNIVSVCGQAPGSNPQCGSPATAVVVFSVTDPTGATTHGYNNAYNIKTDAEFTSSAASLNLLTAWNTSDYTNNGGTGTRPARANSFNLKTTALGASYVDNMNGTYTVSVALPAGVTTGSGTVALEGHPAGPDKTGALTVQAQVKGVTAAFGISDNPAVARRVAVNIQTNCDRCHDLLSVHGNNRSDDAQLCVMCHNPRNTDIGRRTGGGPFLDGKAEESIDFKRMIHGIHAGAKSNFDGTLAHGFREKGMVIYGFGSPFDASHMRFPGVLNRCTTCHVTGAYQLTGKWADPTGNGILGSTINSGDVNDQSDDLVISPIAAVCSACHDSAIAQSHMTLNGGKFGVLQSAVVANGESCPICHGPGKIASIDLVHQNEFGEDIP
jgi:OmcA/MtrC family decaheme c-type cytochrome